MNDFGTGDSCQTRCSCRQVYAPFRLDELIVEIKVIFSQVSSSIARSTVSALHVRNIGCRDRYFIKWIATSSTHEPPQSYTQIKERNILLYW